jgi:hypothetical protein
MYQEAAERLIVAADRVAQYRSDLVAFVDQLGAKKWDVEVTGPIGDAHGRLATVEGLYRDLAARMRHEGDQGAAAYQQAPWVPGHLLAGEQLAAEVPVRELPAPDGRAAAVPQSEEEVDSIRMTPAGGGELHSVLCSDAAYLRAGVDGNTVAVKLSVDELRDVHASLTRMLLEGGIGVWTVARAGGELRVVVFEADDEAELELGDEEGSIVTVLTLDEVHELHLRLTRMVLRADGLKV